MASTATTSANDSEVSGRRRRRTREDVEQRIFDAARELFAERGYAGTTTREIARHAEVSETLLFRYYGDKAGLFTEVVITPFNTLMADFVDKQSDPATMADADAETRRFTRHVFELFEDNEAMFRAILSGSLPGSGEEAAPGLHGMAPFFAQSVDQVSARYRAAGLQPPFDLHVAVRLGFGMIAASVLLRDALFPSAPRRETVIEVLEHLVATTLAGPCAV